MILEIVSPEATLFKGEVTSVAVPGVDGEFQMLNNHAPIVSLLGKGNVKIVGSGLKIAKEFADKFNKVNEQTFWLPIESGTIEMNDNKIIVLAD
ncbi:ATP synthase epsilon subunit [Flavobacterium cauense R2A-7]|uniref:F-type H+-transporting ATPase subunit epsilon n=1 Tax=Flavobacterium cauense R2A-7 TaxID=1341154 RepID=V6RZ13_9FLAO|nr:F0F1 ATP synthase subunit epsilon [Flavobacterium cauense]ESU19414.1 ATP synthase epsilon subunit [Flavobacterium cauense R2A-7]KGO80376.1 ATP synthase subunit delta [Flavobacterium cauense R2A-7]TWI08291.1 F-type H+-transporting ATPase subunit epsilon [Flavobacterium cauense R2A-7]